MILSTLCYIEKDGKYLMLHRTKKKNYINLQWIEKDKVTELNTWEGDKIFVDKIKNNDAFFTIKFNYDGEKLIKYDLKEY